MIFAIITAWLAYKRAKENGRSGVLWAIAGAATFIGTQLLVYMAVGIILGLGVAVRGWSETLYDDFAVPIAIIAIIASFGASWLLLRYLDKPSAEENFVPPPPPDFGSGT